jgi:hypothetical protein
MLVQYKLQKLKQLIIFIIFYTRSYLQQLKSIRIKKIIVFVMHNKVGPEPGGSRAGTVGTAQKVLAGAASI